MSAGCHYMMHSSTKKECTSPCTNKVQAEAQERETERERELY
jgi:hypothetical protein